MKFRLKGRTGPKRTTCVCVCVCVCVKEADEEWEFKLLRWKKTSGERSDSDWVWEQTQKHSCFIYLTSKVCGFVESHNVVCEAVIQHHVQSFLVVETLLMKWKLKLYSDNNLPFLGDYTETHKETFGQTQKKKKKIPTINSALCAIYRHTHTNSILRLLYIRQNPFTQKHKHVILLLLFCFFFNSCLFQRFAKQHNSTQEFHLFWKHGTPNAAVSSTTTSNEDARQEISLLLLSSSCMNG